MTSSFSPHNRSPRLARLAALAAFGLALGAACGGDDSLGGASNTAGTGGTSGAAAGKAGSTAGGGGANAGSGGSSAGAGGSAAGAGGSSAGAGGRAAGAGGSSAGAGGSAAGAGGNAAGAGGTTTSSAAGYYKTGAWHGCSWTGIDTLPGAPQTTITPKDFVTQKNGDPFCVSGTVRADPMYRSVALLGFNIGEPAGASCAHKPDAAMMAGPPAVKPTKTGIALSFSKKVASTLRVQIQGPNGATDADDRWCYTITEAAGPVFAPFDKFNTQCWDGKGKPYAGQPISAVVLLVPGSTAPQPYDFCVAGFAEGTSVADAPKGGALAGPVSGTLGGPGSNDLDFARVKVSTGGKSYVIQNNNWGKPSTTDQTISYVDNSFKVVSSTGTKGPAGEPGSFPSIYIGNNGNTANGVYSTRSDDGLPKKVSEIKSVNTTFKYNRAQGDYNASYDVWFAAAPPNATYNDAISGFVMVWLYKPPGNTPIGSVRRQASLAGRMWDVWVGPRGGSGSNKSAPVVSYVAKETTLSMTFDLMDFIKDASTNGIDGSWYLTDVFAGFEIWNGADANGLEAQQFTAVVQ